VRFGGIVDFTGKLTVKIVEDKLKKLKDKDYRRYLFSVVKQCDSMKKGKFDHYLYGKSPTIKIMSISCPAIQDIECCLSSIDIYIRGRATHSDLVAQGFYAKEKPLRDLISRLRKAGIKVITGKKKIIINGIERK
jgi:hypothetical protein